MAPFTVMGAARALRGGAVTSVQLAEQVLKRASMVEAQVPRLPDPRLGWVVAGGGRGR